MKIRNLIPGALLLLLCATAQAQTPVPVLHFSFDNVSGATVINDGSGGAAMNGTLNGTATITNSGKFGNALSITGPNAGSATVRIANAVVPLTITNSWTVAMWIQTTTAGGCYAYQGDGGWAPNNTSFYLNNGNGGGTRAGGVRYGNGWETGSTDINDGLWHHVVMTVSNSVKVLYVDGNVDAFQAQGYNGNSWSTTGAGGQFWIGGNGYSGDGSANLNGLIDEVNIYTNALSPSQVAALFSAQIIPVAAAVRPANGVPGGSFKVTATVTPGSGTVTNVSVDLSVLGGSSANKLVLSNANVYTNTFTIPANAPLGAANLTVNVTGLQQLVGIGSTTFTVFSASAPQIVKDTNPTNSAPILAVNEGVTFSAVFSGAQPIFYNWQVSYDNGYSFTDIPNATNTTFTITNAQVSDTGYYQLQASNAFGVTITTASLLLVDNTYNPTYLWSALIPFANLTAEQILTNFPAGNKIAGALVAKNGGAPITVVLTNAGSQPIVFSGAGNWAALSGGAGFFAGANTNLTGNSSFNSVLNDGYTDNATHTITLSNLVVGMPYEVQLFALDDRSGLNPVNSSRYVNFQDPNDANDIVQNYSMADNVYVIGKFTASNSVMQIQQNVLTSSGNFNCLVLRTVGWDPAPYVTQTPVSVSGFLGTNVSLTAGAAGDTTIPNPAVIYQWASGPTGGPYTPLVEGSKYAGTATGTLTISNLTTDDSIPVYVLIAANSVGSVTTKEANVYFQALPVPPAPGSYGAYALSNNPVAFWMLNETNNPATGLLVAYDATGHGHNGTYQTAAQNAFNGVMGPTNLPGFAANQGALQTAANTPASEVFIPPFSLNTNPFAISTNGVTIAMWIKPSQGITPNTGLFFYRNNTVQGFGFGGNSSGGMAELGYDWNGDSAATYNFHSGLYPPLNVWSYVGVVITSNSATFFLYYTDPNSGLPVRLSAVNAIAHNAYTFTGGNTRIGGDPNNANRTFAGAISSVAIYNTALSSGQLIQQYAAGLGVGGLSPLVSGESPNLYFPAPLAAGRSLSITATANGTVPLTNQWTFNGTNLANGAYLGATVSGAQTPALVLSNLTYNNAGSYQLLVTNAYGQTNSKAIQLTILPATLVGQWLSVSNSLADASGYSPAGVHDASVATGSTYWTNDVPAIAPPGSASLFFNGAALQVANSATTDAGYTNTFDNQIYNGLTVMCWAKGMPNGIWNTFVAKNGEDNGWQIRIGNSTNRATWTIRENNQDMQAIRMPFFTNTLGTVSGLVWHHYAGTYNPVTGVRSLYLDGTLIATQTGEVAYPSASAYHLTMGRVERASGTGDGPYTGAMYDVRVYNYALDQGTIASIVGLPEATTQYAIPGEVAKFGTVGINAAPPYTGYQWTFNGANLSDGGVLGATVSGSSTLSMTISNITANNAGLYQLLVTNAAGVTTSSIVKLTVQPTTLVGHWLSGSQSMADGSGFSPAGTHDAGIQSGTAGWSADVPASAPGGSYSLSFTNAGLIVSNSSPWDAAYTNTFDDQIYKDMTVMFWAKVLPVAWSPWVSKQGDNATSLPNLGWQLRDYGNSPNYSSWTIRGTGGNEDMNSSIATGDGNWHHYTGTYSAATGVRALYVDGVLAARQTGQGPYSPLKAAHLMIGAQDNGVGVAYRNYYTGKIYDVRIYNYALTQSQLGATVPGLTPSFASRQFIPGTGGNAGQFVLSWSFGSLLEATNVVGPWTPSGAASPYTNTINTAVPDLFFKLSNP